MIKVFYHYYYLFYSKVIPSTQPRLTALLTVSFSLCLLVIVTIGVILAYTINYTLNRYEMVGILVLILVINYLKYYREEKVKEIIQEQPMFFNSHKWLVVVTVLFFLFTSSILFWGNELIISILGSS
jgi:Ca2+/Na+ antiporter